jgi:hypothetical protein
VVLHPSAGDDAIGVVPVERQGIVAVRTGVGDPVVDLGEELSQVVALSALLRRVGIAQ